MNTRSIMNGAILLAVYLTLFMLYNLGLASILIALVLPIPFIIQYIRTKDIKDTLWLFVGACVGSSLIGSVYGLATTVLAGLTGLILAYGQEKKWPYWNRILNASIAYVVIFPTSIYLLTGISITDMFLQQLTGMESIISELPLETEEQLAIIEQAKSLIPMIMPTVMLLMGLFNTVITDKISSFFLKLINLNVKQYGSFKDIQLGKPLAITFMLTQLMGLFITNTGLTVVAVNIIMLLTMLFMVQGFVVINTLFTARGQKGLGIGISVVAALSGMTMFIMMFGIVDAIVDYRQKANITH